VESFSKVFWLAGAETLCCCKIVSGEQTGVNAAAQHEQPGKFLGVNGNGAIARGLRPKRYSSS
jgi:hypothetical protein